jgi:hypothetical protein
MNMAVFCRLVRPAIHCTSSAGGPVALEHDADELSRHRPDALCSPVAAQDERVPPLEADEDLVDDRRHGIRQRDEREHDAHRGGDVRDLAVRVGVQRVRGGPSREALVDRERREAVLRGLVRHVPHAGLLDRGRGNRLGAIGDDVCDVREQRVDPVLPP